MNLSDFQGTEPATGRGDTDLDDVRRRLALMEEFLAWRRLVERSRGARSDSNGDARRRDVHFEPSDSGRASVPRPTSRSESKAEAEPAPEMEWMRRAQRALVSHPVATQSAFVALAREGRAFAETEQGRAWARILQDAPAVQRLRTLWEAANFTLTADEGDAPLPSAMIELFVRTATSGDVDAVAARLGMPFLEAPPAFDARSAEEDAE